MELKIPKTVYELESVATGKRFPDAGWMMDAPGESKPSLIRAIYEKKRLEVKPKEFGLYQFADWWAPMPPIAIKARDLPKPLG